MIPVSPRPNFNKADWAKFQTYVRNNLHGNNLNNEIIETIDAEVENWHQTIQDAIKQSIPLTHYKPLPTPKHSDTTKILITLFTELQTYTKQHGWDIEHYKYYKNLQSVLQESLINENNENSLKLIQDLSNSCNNPTIFWDKIKRITGNTIEDPHYLKDVNNTKIYTNEGKEELHREHWEEVFNAEFEEDNTTEHVFEHLRNNIHRTIPYNSSDLSRLDSNVIDSTITEEEVKKT